MTRSSSSSSIGISIHALREEGDLQYPKLDDPELIFLSTPSARRATCCRGRPRLGRRYFYPRPPRGGRLARVRMTGITNYFYPRPPRGGRL